MIIHTADLVSGYFHVRRRYALDVENEGLLVQVFEQILDRAVGHDAAVVNDRDVAAERFGFFQVMGREDDCRALLVNFAQELIHGAAHLDVHAGRRLIENQDLGLVNHRPGDHQAAFHTTGQHARTLAALVGEPQLIEVIIGAGLGNIERDAVVPGLYRENIFDLLEDIEIEFLRHDTDVGFGEREILVNVDAVDLHLPFGLRHQ